MWTANKHIAHFTSSQLKKKMSNGMNLSHLLTHWKKINANLQDDLLPSLLLVKQHIPGWPMVSKQRGKRWWLMSLTKYAHRPFGQAKKKGEEGCHGTGASNRRFRPPTAFSDNWKKNWISKSLSVQKTNRKVDSPQKAIKSPRHRRQEKPERGLGLPYTFQN